MKLDARVRTRARRVATTAAAMGGFLGANRAIAADIRWQAPPDCDARDHVAAQVEKLLDRKLATVDTVDFEVTVEARDGTWQVRVTGVEREHGEKRTRDLSSRSCSEAAEAAAVAISMAIRSADAVPAEESTPVAAPNASESAEPPAPASPEVTADRRSPAVDNEPTEPPRTPLGGMVSVLAILDRGSLPNASPGIAVEASVRWKLLRVTAQGGVLAAQTREVPRGGGGEFQLVFGGARACAAQTDGRVRPLACAGLEIGRLSGEGVGVPVSHSGSALWLAADADVGLAVPFSEAFAFSARLGAVLPLQRPEFALGGTEVVFRPASFAGRGAVGLDFSW